MARTRLARIVDAEAVRLLLRDRAEPCAIVSPGGFPCVRAAPPSPPYATIVDASRPEEPDEPAARIAALVRQTRPGGTIRITAVPDAPAVTTALGPRTLSAVVAAFAEAGCTVVDVTPFDLLGPCSPWRAALGPRRERVLAELEEHLRFAGVRRLVRLLERHVAPTLGPDGTGRLVVTARAGSVASPPAPPAATPPLAALLAPAVASQLLTLAHDDAVVRFVAFVDGEWLAPLAVPLDLRACLRTLADDPARRAAIAAALRAARRFWQPDLETARLREAMSHRLRRRTLDALAAAPDAPAVPPALLEALEYDLACAFHAELDRIHDDAETPWTAG